MNSVEQCLALPPGWVRLTLGETADIVRGVSFPKNARKLEPQAGHVACLRTANVQREVEWGDLWFVPEAYIKAESRYVQPLDVLISVSNSLELVGKVAQVTNPPQKSTLGAFISLLRFSSRLDAKCFYHQMASPEVQTEIRNSASTTTNISNISSSNLSGITLKILPLPEQHRIVAEIEKQFTRLDATVVALKRVQDNLKRYRASVLKAACEGKLVPVEAELAREEDRDYEPADRLLDRILSERRVRWASQPKRRGKYKEPVAPDTSALPELPEGWVWARLGSIGEVRLGRQRSPKRAIGPNMRPYLRAANVTWNGLDLSDVKEMDFNPNEFDVYQLRLGDILLAEASGSADEVGKPAIWNNEINACCFQNTLIRVRCDREVVPYIFYHLLSDARSGTLGRAARGVGIHHLGAEGANTLVIALPPLADQRRIVAEVERRLSIIQQAEGTVEASLKRAERLRQSILKQAFSGKLATQDPNDEPASVLLERIRAERAAAVAAIKRKNSQTKRHRSKTSRQSQLAVPERTLMTTATSVGQKLWNYCNVLRDAGLSYGDYLEQLTFLIFLKMMHERSQPPYTLLPEYQPPPIPQGYDWPSLLSRDGDELERHYRLTLETLGREPGTLGVIFSKAQNRIQEPAMLTRLIKDLIDSENWLSLSADVKGDAYESLLERNAQDVKSGAGQYFTPRPLIQAIVDVMRPEPDTTICDPACGTGGFLLAAHDYIVSDHKSMDRGQLEHLRDRALFGWDIVDSTARLGVMNLYLHGIGGDNTNIVIDDSLRNHPGVNFDMVLTNPPFGRKSSLTFVNSKGESARESLVVERPDFWATGSNKQLNFLQHVRSLLKINGRAAAVVPDNVLFEGGAGETVRRRLMMECDVHTLLRLPTGVFYAQGVKANVLFFDRRPASESPWTKDLWIYDLRTNQHFTLKTNPLTRSHLDEFVACYNPENRHEREESERFRRFSYDDLVKRDKASLDILWLRDESMEDSASLPPPDEIAEEILEDLRAALEQLEEISADFAREPA